MPPKKIRKRDGRIVDFDQSKITEAIFKAARAVGGSDRELAKRLSDQVVALIDRLGYTLPSVEEVQDLVEKVLIENGHAKTAKAYILYRKQHQDIRETKALISAVELMDDYLDQIDWRVRENSNMGYSLQGLNNYLTSALTSNYWLMKVYPPEVGRAHTDGDFHIHDLGILAPYTYYGREVVVAKKDGRILLCSMEDLYRMSEGEEVLLSRKDGAWAKYPKGLYVLDRNGWTEVLRLVRKRKDKQMFFVKNRGGRSVIVTEDHPLIVGDDPKRDLRTPPELNIGEDKLFTVDIKSLLEGEKLFYIEEIDLADSILRNGWRGKDKIYCDGRPLEEGAEGEFVHTRTVGARRKIKLTEDFGYFVGLALADGFLSYDAKAPRTVSLSQKDGGEELERAAKGLRENGFLYIFQDKGDGRTELLVKNPFLRYLFEVEFGITPGSRHKSLPVGILMYNMDFVRGVLAGLLDGDANFRSREVTLRIAARTMLEQAAVLLHFMGFTPRDRRLEGQGSVRKMEDREIRQNYPLYGLWFRTLEVDLPSERYRALEKSRRAWHDEDPDSWHVVTNVDPVEVPDEDIYDITTKSTTLVVNGMWNHNCVGWDLRDLLIRGFGGVPGKTSSRPPKHLRSALGQLVNFFYTLQGEAAGAQAVSNWDTLLAPFVRYDGLNYRQVKQAVQEFVFNLNVPTRTGFQSLAWDELVVVRRRGKIEVMPIGELVDSQFREHPTRVVPNVDGYGRPSEDSFAVPCYDDIEVLGWEGGKAKWLRAKAFIRHRVPSPIFLKVRTGRGEVFISPGHSLFAFRDGGIAPVKPGQLRTSGPNAKIGPDNHVVALGRIPEECFGGRDFLDLADAISSLPHEAKRNIYVHISDRAFEELEGNLYRRYASKKQVLYELGYKYAGQYYDWREKGMVPFPLWEKLGNWSDEEVCFSLRNYPEGRQERILRGEKLEAFLTVLAYYLTEGKSTASGISISQRAGNLEKLDAALRVLDVETHRTEGLGWSSAGRQSTSTVVEHIALTGVLAYIVKHHCGYTASEKRIPYFVYDMNHSLREKFLYALIEGDGYYDPRAHRYGFFSKSKRMISGVSLLLASLGKHFILAPKDRRTGVYGLFYYPDPKRRWPEEGDFVAAPVYEISEELYPHEWEYDISVESETENFVGGLGGILFHNSPFTNITLDLVPPPTLKDEAVVVGGELKDETYGEFQEEMDMLNRAFAEVMIEGDAQERPFTFPIPTYNISKDFNWDNPVLDLVFEMTAKYGIPYFANFINSDMKPEDAMSMCLYRDEEILIRRHGRIQRLTIGEFVEGLGAEFDDEGWAEVNQDIEVLGLNGSSYRTEWIPVRRVLRVMEDRYLKITTEDGKVIRVSPNHVLAVLTPDGLVQMLAKDAKVGHYVLSMKRSSDILPNGYRDLDGLVLDEDLAKILGYFTADGNYLFRDDHNPRGLQFSFNSDSREIEEIRELLERRFGVTVKEKQDPRYNTYYLYVYNTDLARKLYRAGFRKYGRLPEALFNSPPSVIEAFLDYFFKGDGYGRYQEVHIADEELSRDLVLLYGLIGRPTTYRRLESSQVVYIQHRETSSSSPLLHELVPGWMARSTYAVPGLNKGRMVGLLTLDKYNAHTEESRRIADVYVTRISKIEEVTLPEPEPFYDVELEREHLFVHSLGTVTHNCCRLRIDRREVKKRGGGLFAANPLTGSIGVVTINLPRIGYLSQSEEEFFERLGRLMDIAKVSLEIKRKVVERFTEEGLYPYARVYLEGVKASTGRYWDNHFSTIGLIGMNEALLNFMGKDIADPEGYEFAVKVLKFMRDRLYQYQQETDNLYNLEATPAEGATYRLARLDKARFPDIITAGGDGEPYYTNSTHLPVYATDDLYEALKHQDGLQVLYTGGTVLHGFVGERLTSKAVKLLVRRIAENFHIPYYTITPTFSICPAHGYIPGEHPRCPKCGEETEVYSRVVGYLRPVRQWNDGKQSEFRERRHYRVGSS